MEQEISRLSLHVSRPSQNPSSLSSGYGSAVVKTLFWSLNRSTVAFPKLGLEMLFWSLLTTIMYDVISFFVEHFQFLRTNLGHSWSINWNRLIYIVSQGIKNQLHLTIGNFIGLVQKSFIDRPTLWCICRTRIVYFDVILYSFALLAEQSSFRYPWLREHKNVYSNFLLITIFNTDSQLNKRAVKSE